MVMHRFDIGMVVSLSLGRTQTKLYFCLI